MRTPNDWNMEVSKRIRDRGSFSPRQIQEKLIAEIQAEALEEKRTRIVAAIVAATAGGVVDDRVYVRETIATADRLLAAMQPKPDRSGSWIQTASGKQFWPYAPSVDDICIEDIAHALANQCRFTGHTKEFYSVAEHSVRVSLEVSTNNALWGLLHDASEGYIIDLAAPLKRQPEFIGYRDIEAGIMRAVCAKFGLGMDQPSEIALADIRMLATEKRDVMGPAPAEWMPLPEPYPEKIVAWPPAMARSAFMNRFEELTR